MSIAEQEALKRYLRSDYPVDIDYFGNDMFTEAAAARDAYVAGRTAEPTDVEIEAAAIVAVNKLHGVYPDSMPCWEDSSEDTQSRAKQYAVYMLPAARKAVAE